jgi:hypothetical protein
MNFLNIWDIRKTYKRAKLKKYFRYLNWQMSLWISKEMMQKILMSRNSGNQ